MQIQITLSRKEKRYYFLYLLGMLCFAVGVVAVAVLFSHPSPFSESDMHAIYTLQEKNRFEEARKPFQKQTDSTFSKLEKFDAEKTSPLEENDIKMGISEIQNAFALTNVKDPRISAFEQIGRFYKMFYDDKKSAAVIEDNIRIFEKQFDDCSVGYRDRRQQMMQRENAELMSNRR